MAKKQKRPEPEPVEQSSSSSDSDSGSEPSTKKRHVASTPLASSEAAISANGKERVTDEARVVVLLDQARLETVKTRTGDFVLLNCDDHRDICRKQKLDPSDFRPDIVHQELLALIDSPLNKAGKLQVYLRTTKNVLIEINPQVRIPRTFKRFSGLMVQLLHKLKIKAGGDSNVTLLKVIKNPFTLHLPAGIRVYGMSHLGEGERASEHAANEASCRK
tara:strand:- start:98 stop:751 length:654 start_codon:yes stop_codon:yes gene_type:complete